MKKLTLVAAILFLSVLLWVGAGCKSRTDAPETAPATVAASLPPSLMLSAKPEAAVNVTEAKQAAKAGDEIVVRGKIGGRVKPFVDGRAIFQLVDSSMPTCADTPGDKCPTPWDYCCEPKDQVTAKSATVQVVGPDGKPLIASLEDYAGLKPMATVVIRGKVAARPNDTTMIVNAEGIYVE